MRVTVVSEAHYRFRMISRARSMAIWPMLGLILLFWWSFFAWAFLLPGVFVSLCVPPGALWAARKWPTLLTLRGNKRNDLRASLEALLICGPVVPLLVAHKLLNCANLPLLILPALIGGGALTAWALRHDEALRQRTQDAAYVGLYLMIYAAMLALWLNHALPAVTAQRAALTVTGLRTNQNITGPVVFDVQTSASPFDEDGDDDEYSVPRKLWQQLQVGATVCLTERWGVFGVADEVIGLCPERPAR